MATGLSNLGKDYPDAFGSGTNGRLILTALAGAMEGNLSGSATDLLGSTAASVIRGLGAAGVKELLNVLPEGAPETETIRAGLQAILGCAAGAASWNCASGALGAAGSVVLGNLVELASDQKVSTMSQDQKDQLTGFISAVTGGVAGALGGDAGVASLAAQIEAENNSEVLFNRTTHTITLYDQNGNVVDTAQAYNNAQSTSNGPWPDGVYDYIRHTTHANDTSDSSF